WRIPPFADRRRRQGRRNRFAFSLQRHGTRSPRRGDRAVGAHLTQIAAGPIALRYAERVSATVLRDRIFPESGRNGRAPSMLEIILAQHSPLERTRSWPSRSATVSYLDRSATCKSSC